MPHREISYQVKIFVSVLFIQSTKLNCLHFLDTAVVPFKSFWSSQTLILTFGSTHGNTGNTFSVLKPYLNKVKCQFVYHAFKCEHTIEMDMFQVTLDKN